MGMNCAETSIIFFFIRISNNKFLLDFNKNECLRYISSNECSTVWTVMVSILTWIHAIWNTATQIAPGENSQSKQNSKTWVGKKTKKTYCNKHNPSANKWVRVEGSYSNLVWTLWWHDGQTINVGVGPTAGVWWITTWAENVTK